MRLEKRRFGRRWTSRLRIANRWRLECRPIGAEEIEQIDPSGNSVRLVGEDWCQGQLAERVGRTKSLPEPRHLPVFNQHVRMAAMLVQPLGPPVQPVRIENVEADRRAPGVVAQRTGV